jgi:hypothetical protein
VLCLLLLLLLHSLAALLLMRLVTQLYTIIMR